MPFRLRHPLATNPRVKNLFERASFGRVAKHYRPNFRSIQVPGQGKDFVAKLSEDFLFHFWKFDERMRREIGVEEFRRWQNFAQTVTKRAFACGNSARDSDRRHGTVTAG